VISLYQLGYWSGFIRRVTGNGADCGRDPRELRGARVERTVDRADHDILSFSFHTIWIGDKSYPIQSRLVSVTSSHGNEGRDDLDQRVRIEGAGIIAYGVSTALDEGAEVRITAWKT
jgi:hypothetical protein